MNRTALLLLALAASAASAQTHPVTVKHDLGETIVPKKPARVVALSEETAELLAVLGEKPVGFASGRVEGALLGQKLSALTAPAAKMLGAPVYVGSSLSPSMEAVLALKPDLIVMFGSEAMKTNYGALNRIAPTLAWDFNANPSVGWRKALAETAKVFGKTAQANRYMATFDARVKTLQAQVAPAAQKAPRTTFLYFYQPQDLTALGGKFAFTAALERLGFKLSMPPGLKADVVATALSPEGLANLDADRVLVLRRKLPDGTLLKHPADAVLRRQKLSVVSYPLDRQEPQGGPITDLKRIEALAKLLR